ncbi:alpha/beta hydrolase [Mycolicibacterium hodleri]|uniref:Alpha/beta hydrolase n=1 Tax=Mycolicibacterium hodleri TaxID=49897 RepID=A0A502EJG5_9MYCO|nr:alpha/beta hydrolase [Mycolicibacterium hodleri]TPG36650.1 alpha/beta hydrolase [Mycolicibacterium hodleri]
MTISLVKRVRAGRRWAVAVAAVVAAVNTVNGYRPLSNRGYSSLLAFSSGVFTTELPLQILVSQTAVVVPLSSLAPPRTRRVSRLLWAASCLGLLGLNQVGRRADVPLAAALDHGLGAERRTDSAGLWQRPTSHEGMAKTPGVIRMARVYRDYAHDSDISYGVHGAANHLDIWRRPDLDRSARAPVLVQVPGGAWSSGNKRGQAHPLMSHLTELGWVCVAINYRLSPRHVWPAHIVDVKQAIAWVKTHIADYGGDPDFVAITGGSAGGHLSALAALTGNESRLQPGFEDADTSVQAAVPFYGVYDFTRTDGALHPIMVPFLERLVVKRRRHDAPDVYSDASPITHVGPGAPPFFVLHGRSDSFIPVDQARSFVARLRAASNQPVVYAELPLAQHAFDVFGSARAAHAAVAVEQFLAEVYARRDVTP